MTPATRRTDSVHLHTLLRQRSGPHQGIFISQSPSTCPERVYGLHASRASLYTSANLSRGSGSRRKNLRDHLGLGDGKEVKKARILQSPFSILSPQRFSTSRSAMRPERKNLPHLDTGSEVHQISVGHKVPTRRVAVAVGVVRFSNPQVKDIIKDHALKKGDVLAVARVAGIMAVKNTSNWIPLAHNNVAVEGCWVDLNLVNPEDEIPAHALQESGQSKDMTQPIGSCGGLRIKVTCESTGKTGVEMEAMCGVVGAALTVVDMCKAVDKEINVGDVKTIGKKGGNSGDWGIFTEGQEE